MTIRAVIFDVYNTLLEVGPPGIDADDRWKRAFVERKLPVSPLDRDAFFRECGRAIEDHHARSKERGISNPEVNWPVIVRKVLPETRRLSPAECDRFIFDTIQTIHQTRLIDHVAVALRILKACKIYLGIASNAQSYTLLELDRALAENGISENPFDPFLCYWSFEHGFSKPSPYVFQILTARLEALGVSPSEILMIGDRMDNDIIPARAFGWQTWQIGRGTGWAAFIPHFDIGARKDPT